MANDKHEDPMEGVVSTPATNADAAEEQDWDGEGEEPEEVPGACCYCGDDVELKHVAPNSAIWFTCAKDCCAKVGEPA